MKSHGLTLLTAALFTVVGGAHATAAAFGTNDLVRIFTKGKPAVEQGDGRRVEQVIGEDLVARQVTDDALEHVEIG